MSPTRILLIINRVRTDPRWGLPGGTIEDGETVIEAAVRECWEETGMRFEPAELSHKSEDGYVDGRYVPNLCVAHVSEEKLDTHTKHGDENGQRLCVATFPRTEVAEMPDLNEVHRPFIQKLCA